MHWMFNNKNRVILAYLEDNRAWFAVPNMSTGTGVSKTKEIINRLEGEREQIGT